MTALVQRRLGIVATRCLLEDLVPSPEFVWVDQHLHDNAVSACLAGLRRRVSFEIMRRHGIEFAFDRDFDAQGFETVP